MDEHGSKRTNEELVAEIKGRDDGAVAQLLEQNQPLIKKFVAREFHALKLDPGSDWWEDAIQAAEISVWQAALKFEPERGFKFSTLMVFAIRGAVQKELTERGLIRVPRHRGGEYSEETTKDRRKASKLVWIDQVVGSDGEDGGFQVPDKAASVVVDVESRERDRIIELVLSRLPEREAEIARRRMLGDTLEEIGNSVGVSRERIRQIEPTVVPAVKAAVLAMMGQSSKSYRLSAAERSYARLACQKVTIGRIAKDLGRSHATIEKAIGLRGKDKQEELGVRDHRWTAEDREFLTAHRSKGWPWCAKQLGRSVVSVRSKAARWGLEKKYFELTDKPKLKRLLAEGLTSTEIAREFGCTDECIRTNCHKLGLKPPGMNERWRASQRRRKHAGTLHKQKRAQHETKARSLGWPGRPLAEAVVLAAIGRIGEGDRDAVAAACALICAERCWRPLCSTWRAALQYIMPLRKTGLIAEAGRGNRRRIYSLSVDAVGSPKARELSVG